MALCVMATPFYITTRAHAQEARSEERGTRDEIRETRSEERDSWRQQYRLEDGWYELAKDSMVLKWGAGGSLNANYIWRGMYCGGLCVQPEIEVGFEGFRAGMWWNIGATNWEMRVLNPEVDVYLSYTRWGLTFTLMEMYYFDHYQDGTRSRFFDMGNHGPGEGGVTTEVRLKYRISDRLPLSVLWCTRFNGRDGYYETRNEKQETRTEELRRAYSTYIEIGYDFSLPWELTLEARLGITPWRSLYTGYKGGFSFVNTNVRLTRSWEVAKHADVYGLVQLMVNPYNVKETGMMWNVGMGVRLK